jgi:hypothetical protein
VLAERMGTRLERAHGRLWGEHYYDPDAKQWCEGHTLLWSEIDWLTQVYVSRLTTCISPTTGKTLPRAFCQFVLQPIYKVLRGCMGGADMRPALKAHLDRLGIDCIDDATLASLDDG